MVAALSAIAMSGLMVGCASSKGPEDPVAAWQADRFKATEIAAANEAARPLKMDDVLYKSTLEQEALAAPINALAPVPAAFYLKVVKGVDKMAAEQDGRQIYIGVQNDLAAGAKWEDLKAAMMDPATKNKQGKTAYESYVAYQKSIAQVDQDKILDTLLMPMLEQLAIESAKVAVVVNKIKEDPAFKVLAGLELMKAGKNLAADGKALGQQFADATAGASLLVDLLKKDKEAKAFGQNYPVE